MTEPSLRTELDRIARAGAGFEPDPTTWARARRARTRDRAATVLGVAAALVCLVMIGLIARPQGDPVPAGTPDVQLGVPKTIWLVPERLVQNDDNVGWDPRVAETDLAIGRGAVALPSGGRGELVTVITAADGRYHPLELPGYLRAGLINSDNERAPLALSPDGTRLAYGWWDPTAPLDKPMPAGVRILDLLTGKITTVDLVGGNGMRVKSISWSPDGRWIGWLAEKTASWTPMSAGSRGGPVAGRISPAGAVSYLSPALNDATSVAISPAGVLAVQDNDKILTWDGDRRTRHQWSEDPGGAVTAFSPAGRSLALTSGVLGDRFAVANSDWTARVALLPDGFTDERADLTPLGWLDEQTVVVLASPSKIAEGSRLALVTFAPDGGAGYRFVGRVDGHAPIGLSVATDLLKADRTTVVRPEPDWPWSSERKWKVGLLAVAALLIAFRLVRRRFARP